MIGDPSASRRGLPACLDDLGTAIDAAGTLGLGTDEAEAVRREAEERLGVGGEAAVVALVGGTGVGKSTLLNALAGTEISTASLRRPTTSAPVAWVPEAAREDFASVLDWLEVEEVRTHEDGTLPALAILDLPDLDSVAAEHRERVEALLPRVDAVIWLTDPEKYRDAVLHDDFLRTWVPRLDRQLVVLNKVDRLGGDAETVRRDLERSLIEDRAAAHGRGLATSVGVVATAAAEGRVEPVRAWLTDVVDAKRVVVGRLAASILSAIEELCERAGVDPDGAQRLLLEPSARRSAIEAAAAEVVRLVDLDGAERQAVAATRAAARPAGAGPLGRVTAWIYRSSGRERQVADPARHLRAWSGRGALAPAVDVLRRSVDAPLREAPLEIRPAMAGSADAGLLTARLRAAVDGAIASRTPMPAPRSRWWPILGLIQTLATVTIAISAAWLVLLFLFRPPVDVVELPVLGPVPIPLVLLVGGLFVGFVAARLLGWHAGRVGRRWARRLRGDVRAAVEQAVDGEAFAGLDRVDAARRQLWLAARSAREDCRRPR